MKRTPIYAILSGFDFDDLPGVGTFYDFFKRLWPALDKNVKPQKQRKRKTEWMLGHDTSKTVLPANRLFHFFHTHILSVSTKLGLLGETTAGDGTPIVTSSSPRSKPTCDCRAQGLADCKHPRLYSRPDCDSGWDSAREKYFNGYHLYMVSAADSQHDLPLYPRLHPPLGMMRSVWS